MKKVLNIFIITIIFISLSCTPGMRREVYFKEITIDKTHSSNHISYILINKFKFLSIVYQDSKTTRIDGVYRRKTSQRIDVSVSDGFIEVSLRNKVNELELNDQISFLNEMEMLLSKNNIKFEIIKNTPWGINIY